MVLLAGLCQPSRALDANGSPGEVIPYPVPAVYGDKLSPVYHMNINGIQIPVLRYIGHKSLLHTAHVMLGGSATVNITCRTSIASWEVSPASAVHAVRVDGQQLQFGITGPQYLIVRINQDKDLLCIMAEPPETDVPDRASAHVIDMGKEHMDGDGKTVVTGIVQAVIDRVSATGGGTLSFPPGSYRMGTIELRDDVSIYLAGGAVLIGSTDELDFPVTGTQIKHGRFMKSMTMVRAIGRRNIRIFGRGVMDGNAWNSDFSQRYQTALNVVGCTNVRIDGVTVTNSCGWTAIGFSRDVNICRCKSLHDPLAATTDSLDICNCRNVQVDRSLLISGDDAFCIKSCGGASETQSMPSAWGYHGDTSATTEDITLHDSVLYGSAAAIKIGIQVFTDIRNVTCRDLSVVHCKRGLSIEHQQGGANIEHVVLDNIIVDQLVDDHPYAGPTAPIYAVFSGSSATGTVSDVYLHHMTFKTWGPDHSVISSGRRGRFDHVRCENLVVAGITVDNYLAGHIDVDGEVTNLTFMGLGKTGE